MAFHHQLLLPAVRRMKDLEKLMEMNNEYVILLDVHLGQVKPVADMSKAHGKKLLLHADLIAGLKHDEYAAENLCQQIRPAGLISTRSGVIATAKKNNLIAIQRLFLLDTNAVENSCALIERTRPDYIELMPGVIPHMIAEVHARTQIPVFAGGLIRTAQDDERALEAGASAAF